MEQFYNLMSVFNVSSLVGRLSDTRIDIISSLPPEVAGLILRKLDGASLVACMRVDVGWKKLCLSDAVLRHKIRTYLREERKNRAVKENFPSRPKGLKKVAKYFCFSKQNKQSEYGIEMARFKRKSESQEVGDHSDFLDKPSPKRKSIRF